MKKLFFTTLAGVMMFACQTPGGDPTPNNGDTKSISITIKTTAATRAALGHEVTHNVAVTELENGTFYFFNTAGDIVGLPYELTAEQIAAGVAVVPNVPSTAASVTMIANKASDLTPTTTPNSYAAFKAMSFAIANQASMSAATDGTTAAPDAVKGIALLDECGATTSTTAANAITAVTTPNPDYTHTASITLVPAAARIEIGTLNAGGIIVKGPTSTRAGEAESLTGLQSFIFEGLYINNYSNNYTLGFAQDATLFGAGLQSGGSDDWAAAYKALTNPAACSYLYDEPATGQSVNRVTGVGQFAYHVFPGAEAPHIVIKGSNFVYADGRNFTDTHYWLIDKYWEAAADGSKTDVEVTWEPGYVYKITRILVGDTIPTKDPYDDPITVQVTVSVTPWQVTPVFVTPN